MKASELRKREDEELLRLKDEAQDQLFRSRVKNATHQLDDTSSIRKSRRELARLKTVFNERAKGINVGAVAEEEE